jgi:small subunit ribosomal protein S13
MSAEQNYKERIVRILSKDIEGDTPLYSGLTQIKGISWGMANAICNQLKLDKFRKIGMLNEEEVKQIEAFVKSPEVPKYLLNRRKDFTDGEDKHLLGADLDLVKSFDIKRLRQIKSYRGRRHLSGLPTRGQRTRSNFRKNRTKKVGIKKKKKVN